MKQSIQNIALFFLLAMLVSSCSRSLFGNHPDRMVLPGPTEVLYPCIVSKKSETLGCGDIRLERIKEIKESATAVNPVVQFEQQFGAVFYNDFFEILLVEPDLRKSFVAKTVVSDISPIEDDVNLELMKECPPCNAVATITFNDNSFYYPYTAPDNVMKVLNDSYELRGKTADLSFTIYQNKKGEDIKISMVSNKGVVRSYKLIQGSKNQLLSTMRAFKFPKKDRIKS